MEKICIQTITEELTVNIQLAKFEQIVAENASLKTALKILRFVPSYRLEDALRDINTLFVEQDSAEEFEATEDQPKETPSSDTQEKPATEATPDA